MRGGVQWCELWPGWWIVEGCTHTIPVDDAIVMGIPACHEEIPFGGCDIKYGP